MKKVMAVIILLVTVCLPACGKSYNVVEIRFPIEEQQATDVFYSHQLSYIMGDRYTLTGEEGVESYGYSINSPNNNEEGYYGNIYLYTGEVSGRKIEYNSNWDRKISATDFDNLTKMAMALCDLYGEIENKERIVNDFISFADSIEKKKDGESKEWEAEYGRLYFKAYLTVNKDGVTRSLNSFSIRNEQRKEFDDGAKAREAQRYIESNPYRFTDKKLRHPKSISAEKMKKILDSSTLDFHLMNTEDVEGYEIHGSKTVSYRFSAGDSKEDCGGVSTNYNLSGKRVVLEINYMYEDAIEVMLKNDFITEATKIVCRVYDDVKDEKGLLEKVQHKIRDENADHKKFNSSTWYVENKGMYLVAEHGLFKPKDIRTTCTRVWLFTKDSLRAEFYSYREDEGWQGQLYRELFG